MTKPFRDTKAVYDRIGGLFRQLVSDPDYGPMAKGTRSVVRFRLTDPAADLRLNCRKDPVEVHCGAIEGPADLELAMPAALLHEVLLGKAGLADSYKQGLIQVRGSVFRLITMKPLFDALTRLYQSSGRASKKRAAE